MASWRRERQASRLKAHGCLARSSVKCLGADALDQPLDLPPRRAPTVLWAPVWAFEFWSLTKFWTGTFLLGLNLPPTAPRHAPSFP